MNDQLKTFLDNFLHALVAFRMLGSDQRGDYHDWSDWGRIRGRLAVALELSLITTDQENLLSGLINNADLHKGQPFPDERNAGPRISWWELRKRNVAPHLLEKPQAVPVNEPVQLQPVAAPRKLFLLCLLGQSPGSKNIRTFAQPVGVFRLPAPRLSPGAQWRVRLSNCSAKRSAVSGIWPIQNSPGLVLRETRAVAPSPEVLARLQRYGQANAVRTTARTVQLGVTA